MSPSSHSWHVQVLASCRTCGVPLDRTKNKRIRAYCSASCRTLYLSRRHAAARTASGLSQREQQAKNDAKHVLARPGWFQCAICCRWYKRPAHHAVQRHGVTAYEYKRTLGLAVRRGITSDEDHAHMRAQALTHKMDEQLQRAGKRTRYTLDDPRTKDQSNPWGKKGAPRP